VPKVIRKKSALLKKILISNGTIYFHFISSILFISSKITETIMKYKLITILLLAHLQALTQQTSELNPQNLAIPRYANLQAIQTANTTPMAGMMVYNIGTGTNWQYNGNIWANTTGAISFPVNQTVNASTPTLNLTQMGTGKLLNLSHLGNAGNTANFETNNAENTFPTIQVYNQGLGSGLDVSSVSNGWAAKFSKPNTLAGNGVVDIRNDGVGPGLQVSHTGSLGNTANFSSSNNAKSDPTVIITTSNNATSMFINSYASNAAVQVDKYGTSGTAGKFSISNDSNPNGSLELTTNGTGTTLMVNHSGTNPSTTTTNNLAQFMTAEVNVARIDKIGKGFFNGGTQSFGADLAEAFEVEGEKMEYEEGDVLAISINSDRKVEKASEPYSYLVAGVYATKPGVLLSDEHIDSDLSEHIPMGIIGIIPTKVCNEGGRINRGDFIVSSSQAGYAMKGNLEIAKTGQIIGKALENFDGTKGKIKVLVNIH
jgi:trimeric autotransporter adhesin